jgi:glycerophosphoryl diester phosphodiesterase
MSILFKNKYYTTYKTMQKSINGFDVHGHRGARGLRPENTLPAFAKAIQLGVTTIEMDVGITKDKQIIVTHDMYVSSNICRRKNGTSVNNFIGFGPLVRNMTLKDLQELDCGSMNNSEIFPSPPRINVPGAIMPSLQQVFDLSKDIGNNKVCFNIEIKFIPFIDNKIYVQNFVKSVVKLVQENNLQDRVIIQSFDWNAIKMSKKLDPTIRTAALVADMQLRFCKSCWLDDISIPGDKLSSLSILKQAKHYIDIYSPDWKLIDPTHENYLKNTVQEIQKAGFLVIPFTPNNVKDLERVIDLGVDGAITDYPDRLINILKKRNIKIKK